MKRISVALLLTLLSSTAYASGYSFAIGGHRLHIEASRHCRSLSCVSWSEGGSRRLHRDDDEVTTPLPAKPLAAAPACAPVATPSAPSPVAPPVPAAAPVPIRAQVAPAPVAPVPAPIVQPAPVQPSVTPPRVAPASAPSTIELAAANTQPVVKAETGKP